MRLTREQLSARLAEQQRVADTAIRDMHAAIASTHRVVDEVLSDVEVEMRKIKAPAGAQDKLSLALREVARKHGVTR